jgi:hypothetical protein
MRSVTWIGVTVASVERNGQKNSTSICGTPWYFNVWCGILRDFVTGHFFSENNITVNISVYMCVTDLYFSTSLQYRTRWKMFEQDCAPPSVSYEVWNTLNVPHTNRGSKEADKDRVSKEDQTSTSEFFMCRFLRVRFAQRKTQNSVTCETELVQVWRQSIRQWSKEHGKKLSTV